MSKTVKRVKLSVLCAILLACAVTVGVLFGTKNTKPAGGTLDTGNNTTQGGNNASGAAGALGSNNETDYVVTLGGTAAEMEKQWKTYMAYNGSVTVILKNHWNATSGSFGTCAAGEVGFGSTGLIQIPASKVVVLNLNGFNINRGLASQTSAGYVVDIGNNATLVLNGTGDIKGGNAPGTGCIQINSGATFTMYSGNITGNKAGSAGWGGGGVCNNGGTFNMYGGTISGNDGKPSGGVFTKYGSKNHMTLPTS